MSALKTMHPGDLPQQAREIEAEAKDAVAILGPRVDRDSDAAWEALKFRSQLIHAQVPGW